MVIVAVVVAAAAAADSIRLAVLGSWARRQPPGARGEADGEIKMRTIRRSDGTNGPRIKFTQV